MKFLRINAMRLLELKLNSLKECLNPTSRIRKITGGGKMKGFETLEEAVKVCNDNPEQKFTKLGEAERNGKKYHLVLTPVTNGEYFVEVYVETEEGFVPYKHYLPQEVTMALIYWEEKGIERLEDEKWKDYELKKLEEENKWITEIQDDEEE